MPLNPRSSRLFATVGSGYSGVFYAGALICGWMLILLPIRTRRYHPTWKKDYQQGRRILRCLLGHLIRIARAKGSSRFYVDALANQQGNAGTYVVFERHCLPMKKQKLSRT